MVYSHKNNQGYALIKLIVGVAIISTLWQFALPAYNQYMMEKRRGDGHSLLLENEYLLEQCLIMSGEPYNACSLRVDSNQGFYTLLALNTHNTYTISAIPTSKKGQNHDAECQALTINHKQVKSATGTNPEVCW